MGSVICPERGEKSAFLRGSRATLLARFALCHPPFLQRSESSFLAAVNALTTYNTFMQTAEGYTFGKSGTQKKPLGNGEQTKCKAFGSSGMEEQ